MIAIVGILPVLAAQPQGFVDGPGTWTCNFVPEAGRTFVDGGSGTCH